jgi:hypothetical protein
MPETACAHPSPNDMEDYAKAIEEVRGPCPFPSTRVWGFIDGLRLRMLEPMFSEIQSLYYNGWMKTVNCTNVFIFLPTGKISFAEINNPGREHDFTVSRGAFEKLLDPAKTPLYHVVVGDSAFSSAATDTVVGTPEKYVPPAGDVAGLSADQLKKKMEHWFDWCRSVRQSVEHGMRTLQAVWPRLKTPLPSDNAKRGRIIELCVRLHNLNAHYNTHHNQIQTMHLEALLR